MFKKKLVLSDYILIAVNLLPVAGVWFAGWDPVEVFLVYCIETIIIGLFNIVKMGIVTAVRSNDTWYNEGGQTQQHGLLFIFFFLVHYGLFVVVQMTLFFSVSGLSKGTGIPPLGFIFKWPSLLSYDAVIMLAGFIFYYGARLFMDFILTREYRTIPLMNLMFQPYPRIFIQQFTVILGSIFLGFGAGKLFILIFALVKIGFEVFVDYDGLLKKGMEKMKGETKEDQQKPS